MVLDGARAARRGQHRDRDGHGGGRSVGSTAAGRCGDVRRPVAPTPPELRRRHRLTHPRCSAYRCDSVRRGSASRPVARSVRCLLGAARLARRGASRSRRTTTPARWSDIRDWRQRAEQSGAGEPDRRLRARLEPGRGRVVAHRAQSDERPRRCERQPVPRESSRSGPVAAGDACSARVADDAACRTCSSSRAVEHEELTDSPIWLAASPTPSAAYIVATMSATRQRSSSSNAVTGSARRVHDRAHPSGSSAGRCRQVGSSRTRRGRYRSRSS